MWKPSSSSPTNVLPFSRQIERVIYTDMPANRTLSPPITGINLPDFRFLAVVSTDGPADGNFQPRPNVMGECMDPHLQNDDEVEVVWVHARRQY